MAVNKEKYQELLKELNEKNVTLVAVSKFKTTADILELYALGHRDFGENYVQELVDKYEALPKDIRWHFIGHLQSNKVKYIAPFVHLIHGTDGFKLLKEIDKQAAKFLRTINVLLQLHIAQEETKFGLDENELAEILKQLTEAPLKNLAVKGFMGMASFTEDVNKVTQEFAYLKSQFDKYTLLPNYECNILSMGMSNDYGLAVQCGSNMVRIGSLLFGNRN